MVNKAYFYTTYITHTNTQVYNYLNIYYYMCMQRYTLQLQKAKTFLQHVFCIFVGVDFVLHKDDNIIIIDNYGACR